MITYASHWQEIQRILSAAAHSRLNPGSLDEVAQSLRGEADQVAISFTDDPRAYPNESPATNDDDTLQFFLLYGAISFCIWQRDAKGAAVAWSNTIEGEKYVGARVLPPR